MKHILSVKKPKPSNSIREQERWHIEIQKLNLSNITFRLILTETSLVNRKSLTELTKPFIKNDARRGEYDNAYQQSSDAADLGLTEHADVGWRSKTDRQKKPSQVWDGISRCNPHHPTVERTTIGAIDRILLVFCHIWCN